jgi:hypothetical protein
MLRMIQDVDDTLLALVRSEALGGASVEVALDAPTREWVARRNGPTVDLYLYDIREDMARREVQWERVLDDAGRVTERRPPPRRFKLAYMVTAWTQRPEDEHRLLSSLLGCFIRHERLAPASVPAAWPSSPAPDREHGPAPGQRPLDRRPVVGPGRRAEAVARPDRDRAVRHRCRPGRRTAGPRGAPPGDRHPERWRGGRWQPANGPPAAARLDRSSADETRRTGTDKQPGRIVRVRGLDR